MGDGVDGVDGVDGNNGGYGIDGRPCFTIHYCDAKVVIFRGKRLSLPEIFWYNSSENSKLKNLKTQHPIAFQ